MAHVIWFYFTVWYEFQFIFVKHEKCRFLNWKDQLTHFRSWDSGITLMSVFLWPPGFQSISTRDESLWVVKYFLTAKCLSKDKSLIKYTKAKCLKYNRAIKKLLDYVLYVQYQPFHTCDLIKFYAFMLCIGGQDFHFWMWTKNHKCYQLSNLFCTSRPCKSWCYELGMSETLKT